MQNDSRKEHQKGNRKVQRERKKQQEGAAGRNSWKEIHEGMTERINRRTTGKNNRKKQQKGLAGIYDMKEYQ